ncbi:MULTISPECIES: 50S ribosomal protein L22 [Thermaerobacter]|uniref:Large ribosomal subunit protein uL22 n=1 Tax=Thermaerobacter composti TaxID=554949 RepID=A0ABZ0QRM4_9FIRM|nr:MULTISPECIES: 50S ribosomal protein L22 [Thermaerobacter]PZN09402.1 MAG: 50S ribosomal protein L22 [Bacillota bacterium]QBS37027.1 50S ribosomal protein L22 [Thermaerobacter sp. FW80]WPD19038.1 50S ribosomal protein L22 [Thermaerobacter composti]
MEARAVARFVRVSPRKARQVIDLVRGKPVGEALTLLRYTPKKAARIVEKVVRSAVANATNNHDMDEDRLYITKAYVDEGPRLKRWRPRARGRAFPIRKPTSHVTVIVAERKEG